MLDDFGFGRTAWQHRSLVFRAAPSIRFENKSWMEVNLIVTPQLASLTEKWTKPTKISKIFCAPRDFIGSSNLLPYFARALNVNTFAPAPGGIEDIGLAMLARSPGLQPAFGPQCGPRTGRTHEPIEHRRV
jgi:hypothetical protein